MAPCFKRQNTGIIGGNGEHANFLKIAQKNQMCLLLMFVYSISNIKNEF
jgi:hypothetical protein